MLKSLVAALGLELLLAPFGTATAQSPAPQAGTAPTTIAVLVEAGTIRYHEEIAKRYMEEHPGVRIGFRSPVSEYSELVRQTLFAAQTNTLPDVGFYGHSTLRVLVDRGVAQPLDALIAAEGPKALGYRPALMSIARFEDKQYGIPFAISLPVLIYNADLVRKAGDDPDRFPSTWDGVIALAAKINALGDGTSGLFVRMDDTWIWQALLFSQGGAMMSADQKRVTFDEEAGRKGVQVLHRVGAEAKMPGITYGQARQLFSAGKLGVLVGSSSIIEGLARGAQGRFDMRTASFPDLNERSRLPAGGNTAVLLAKDPERVKAAWDYIKYATGPVAQTFMVKATGNMPVSGTAVETPDLLGDFYRANRLHAAAVSQLDRATEWHSFPGPNGLKIDEVITKGLLDVIYGRKNPETALPALVQEVRGLL